MGMKRSKAVTEEKSSPESLKLSWTKYNNNKYNLLVFYKRLKKYNETKLTKNKIDINNQKIKIIHPPRSKRLN